LCENITTATYGFSNKTYPYHVQVGLPKEALENSKSCMYYGISKKEVNLEKINAFKNSKFSLFYVED